MVLWDHLLYHLLNNISEFYPLLKSFDSFLQNKRSFTKCAEYGRVFVK